MENDLRWKTTFDGRQASMGDVLPWIKYGVMKYDIMKYDDMKYDVLKYDILIKKEDLHIAWRHTALDIFCFALFFSINPDLLMFRANQGRISRRRDPDPWLLWPQPQDISENSSRQWADITQQYQIQPRYFKYFPPSHHSHSQVGQEQEHKTFPVDYSWCYCVILTSN